MNTIYKRLKVLALYLGLSTSLLISGNAQTKTVLSDSFSFAFITDIHLDYNDAYLRDFDSAVKKINSLNPDFVITGGDNIKDAARPSESRADSLFNLYLSRIKAFKMPVHTGIGNHEVFGINNPTLLPGNPLFGKKMYESRIGKTYYSFIHKGWKFFMIDDIKITDSGHKYIGYVDEEQMKWLKSELESTDNSTPIVICAHIPFVSSMKKFEMGSLAGNPVNDGVANSIDFFKLFEKHNLKLMLQGHFHFMEVLYTNEIYYITGPSVNGSYGSALTKKSGFFLFKTLGDSLTWNFIGNN
jgi:DNA repair exonuclease SbcCD nuclease subunit